MKCPEKPNELKEKSWYFLIRANEHLRTKKALYKLVYHREKRPDTPQNPLDSSRTFVLMYKK